ncbi:NAD(P)H-dependent oxidoreductase [Flavobacteriaceae bacterium 3-367]
MKRLLRIDSSSRKEGSHSRKLADLVEEKWKTTHPKGKVVYRDLADFNVPHIHNKTIQGFYTPHDQRGASLKAALEISDELITELNDADDVLISSPLYNLNVPSNLKAYFDQVVRVGKTFGIDEDGKYFGMLKNKGAYLALCKGGSYLGTPMEPYDFQEPYLKTILGHMGIETKRAFSLEGTAYPEQLDNNMVKIKQQLQETF